MDVTWIDRPGLLERIQRGFSVNPCVALLGPRQCGKTTLARAYIARHDPDFAFPLNYLDLEDPAHLSRLGTPRIALEALEGLVVIDEVQRAPDLFQLLRVLVDRPRQPARFLILGSASRDLLQQSSETLAGRISFVEVTPFTASELGVDNLERSWLRGGFPPSFLAETDDLGKSWRESFVRTFLERDIPALGIQVPPATIRRFWLMLAHYHGQMFNASEIGKSLGASDTTVSRYLDILTGTLMVRRLTPWFESVRKRQVKRPKIFFRDSGILHHLLGIGDKAQLLTHPRLGASWEGFALEEIIRLHAAKEEEVYFWGVHQQTELDLLLLRDGKRLGFEVKYTDAPRIERGMKIALELLRLEQLTIVCPGSAAYPVDDRVRVRGLDSLVRELS